MFRKQDLPGILLGLGNTPDEVAATLTSCGIQGVRNTIRHLNPIVRYVERQLHVDDFQLCIEQGNGYSEMKLRLGLPDGKREKAVLPEPVRDFLDEFNSGQFKELELPPDNP